MFRANFFHRSVRHFASEAAPAATNKSGKLLLNFTAPSQTFFEDAEVERVDIPASSGDMGILANHVPTIQQLKPGIIDVTLEGGKNKKVFVSGGFAVVNPDNTLNINVLEAASIDQIDKNNVKQGLSEAQKTFDRSTSDAEKALAAAQIEVYQALEKNVA